MTSLTDLREVVDVVIGVDTHVHTHSAAAVDARTGGVLGEVTVEATADGYTQLAAFAEEIYWAGITAVPRGQWDAARALGFRFLPVLFLVVLPQAVRMVIPPLTNRTIAITKGTALASVVGVSEILGAAQSSMAFSANPTPLTLGAIAYAVLFLPVVGLGRWIERRFTLGRARSA